MPKIPRRAIDSVFYLFASEDEAARGENAGGTGFVVEYRDEISHYYGVSNRHVVRDDGFSVIRFNTVGSTETFNFGPEEWEAIADGEDIAVVPLDFSFDKLSLTSVSVSSFATERDVRFGDIGIGDDVFMIGLFLDHGGVDRNRPLARFGNISMLPDPSAPIKQKNNLSQSYIVDMHSRTGFSGSPVFAYRTFGQDLDSYLAEPVSFDPNSMMEQLERELRGRQTNFGRANLSRVTIDLRARMFFKFLGIHWAQFPETWEVKDPSTINNEARKRQLVVTDGKYIEGFSGMTCVAPSWKILEVLNMPKLKERRAKAKASSGRVNEPRLESAPRANADAKNPEHKQDFENLLNAAIKRKPPSS
jgi:hypothetical protein